MLKTKIIFTALVVYEIIAIILLHDTYTCNAMFTAAFCLDSAFKYFLFCIAIPLLALLIWMWIDEIFVARRRRHSLMHRAGVVMSGVATGIKNQMGRAFDMRDMDKYLTAAILFGIKKYSDSHPQIRRTVHEIISGANHHGDYVSDDDYDDSEYDDEYDDDDNESVSRSRQSATRQSSSRSTTNGGTSRRASPSRASGNGTSRGSGTGTRSRTGTSSRGTATTRGSRR